MMSIIRLAQLSAGGISIFRCALHLSKWHFPAIVFSMIDLDLLYSTHSPDYTGMLWRKIYSFSLLSFILL